MYCCRTYNFYHGVSIPSVSKATRKKASAESISQEEAKRLEEERFIGVEVTAKPYGIGTVVAQDINNIRVSFGGTEKSYILDRRYVARPRFENDEEIISVFTEYGQKQEHIKRLRRELAFLQV